jgi:uncharacterized membrane protein HdeD (DUF308 family)
MSSQDQPALDQLGEALHGPPSSQFGAKDLLRPDLSQVAKYWWVELLVGALWIVLAVVILKFNHASVVTVGVLTGILFLLTAVEEFAVAFLDRGGRWLWAIFGVLLTAAGIIALIHPTKTFVGFADILGFVFLLIGIMWMFQAFYERVFNSLWWLTLISGILMMVLAIWVSDKLFIERAYTLLLFTGVWAMMAGITAIIRAFEIRRLASD